MGPDLPPSLPTCPWKPWKLLRGATLLLTFISLPGASPPLTWLVLEVPLEGHLFQGVPGTFHWNRVLSLQVHMSMVVTYQPQGPVLLPVTSYSKGDFADQLSQGS